MLNKARKTICISYPKGNLMIITTSYPQITIVNDKLVLSSTSIDINLMYKHIGYNGDKVLNVLKDHLEGITLKGKQSPYDTYISTNQMH